jgi:hypothetical protein
MIRSTGRAARGLAAACLLAMLTACAGPTRMVGQWKSADAATYRIGTVLAVAAVEDSTSRRLVEDRMVAALAARGVTAHPSYRWLPEAGPSTEPALGRAISASGADSVLLMSPGKVTTETVVTPGAVMGPPPMLGPGGFYGYYRGVWAPTYIPPTAYTVQSVTSETRLFDARSKTLHWSATTRTDLTESSLDEVARQYSGLIVDSLAADGLIR